MVRLKTGVFKESYSSDEAAIHFQRTRWWSSAVGLLCIVVHIGLMALSFSFGVQIGILITISTSIILILSFYYTSAIIVSESLVFTPGSMIHRERYLIPGWRSTTTRPTDRDSIPMAVEVIERQAVLSAIVVAMDAPLIAFRHTRASTKCMAEMAARLAHGVKDVT